MTTIEVQRDMFGARIGEYAIPPHASHAKCASCGAAMIWIKTPAGKAMPLSAATIETRDGVRYALAHFSDCPDAKEWSGKK